MPDEAGHLFEVYVEDDRYAVPTLRFVLAADDLSARAFARKVLDESTHHRGVEVRLGDRHVAALRASAPLAPCRAGAATDWTD